jgi:hypothetical protein
MEKLLQSSVSALLPPRLRLAVVGFEPGSCHVVSVVDNVRLKQDFSEVFVYPLSLFRSPACFGQINWPISGGHVKRYFKLELSHAVTTVVVFTTIKIINIGL